MKDQDVTIEFYSFIDSRVAHTWLIAILMSLNRNAMAMAHELRGVNKLDGLEIKNRISI